MRLALLVLLAACGPSIGKLTKIGGSEVGVQSRSVGPARLVGFVDPEASSFGDGARAAFSLALPGGDWLASVNGSLVRLAPDGTTVRWLERGLEVWDAVAVGERVIAVGTIADKTALNGARRTVYALELATGKLAWWASGDPVFRGADARLARAGSMTVVATAYGELGVDDAGQVRWTTSRKDSAARDPIIAAVDDRTVVVAWSRQIYSHEAQVAERPMQVPLHLRTLDAATGSERGSFDLAPEGDFLHCGELVASADRRFAIQAWDVRYTKQPVEIDGKTVMATAQVPTPQILLLDLADPARPRARMRPFARPAAIEPMPAKLGASEVVFLDRYATPSEPLTITILDLATQRGRRAILLRPVRVAVGDGVDSFVQVLRLTTSNGRVSFAGIFAGEVQPLRARVEEVDRCEANGGIECSNGRATATVAPFAGMIGSVF